MDFNTLKDQVSNLTLYDLKAGVRKVQNAVMNYTEMEAKVREATNNEPWGASSTIMQEISNGTHSYQLLNEIMPMIYKRFTDKSAEEWRQIYKALQLLEFLIKNGSERVIDDARSHLSLLRMLRQFHYIDQNGKDQGVNVRNRAQELAKMLNDVDTIRAERKKARANRNKFGGVEGGMGMSGGFSTGSRYGGFGSEEPQGNYGGYSGGVYGDGGGFGGQSSDFQDSSSGRKSDRFEEYDEYDEGAVAAPGRRKSDARAGTATSTARREKKAETPKKKEPEPDLLFDDDPVLTSSATSNGKQPATNDGFAADDDDFDDFQSAASPAAPIPPPSTLSSVLPPPVSTTTSHTQFAAPQPVSSQQPNLTSLAGFQSISPAPSSTSTNFSSPPLLQQQPAPTQVQPQLQSQKPATYQPKGPNYFTSVQSPQASTTTTNTTPSFNKPSPSPFGGNKPSTGAAKPASGDAFNNLWSTASAGAGIKTSNSTTAGPKLADMAKQKSSAGIWGTTSTPPPQGVGMGGMAAKPTAPAQQQQQQQYGGGLDDLLG